MWACTTDDDILASREEDGEEDNSSAEDEASLWMETGENLDEDTVQYEGLATWKLIRRGRPRPVRPPHKPTIGPGSPMPTGEGNRTSPLLRRSSPTLLHAGKNAVQEVSKTVRGFGGEQTRGHEGGCIEKEDPILARALALVNGYRAEDEKRRKEGRSTHTSNQVREFHHATRRHIQDRITPTLIEREEEFERQLQQQV